MVKPFGAVTIGTPLAISNRRCPAIIARMVSAPQVRVANSVCAVESSLMRATDFQRMFAYDSWANRECLAAIRAAGSNSADCVGRMAHILSAEKLWLECIQKRSQSMPEWPSSTIDDCVRLAEEMASAWRDYLTELDAQLGAQAPGASLENKLEHRNSKGEPWSSRLEDILTHVLFHSAYHRGQIALQMRASGVTPASTDFIHAVRQGFVE